MCEGQSEPLPGVTGESVMNQLHDACATGNEDHVTIRTPSDELRESIDVVEGSLGSVRHSDRVRFEKRLDRATILRVPNVVLGPLVDGGGASNSSH